jgi:hypothetical protein
MSTQLLRPPGRKGGLVSAALAAVIAGICATAALAAVPNNTTPPTITGSARQGQTLTASNGTWANNPSSFTYQWQRCSASGDNCTGIVSATNATYTPGAADVDNRLRVVVTALNADGQSSATSARTDVISGGDAPVSTAKPTITGEPVVGEEFVASNGTWTGGATTFTYQWQRCDSAGGSCADVTDATSRRYGVRSADVDHRMRVAVTARNASSSATATSDVSAIVSRGTPTPAPTPSVNKAPTIRFLSLKRNGVRIIARFRVCDDGFKSVTIVQRDVKRGVLAYTRRFAATARPCQSVTRNWMLPPRFRHGTYTATLRAVDKSQRTSRTIRRSLFFR